MKKYDPPWDFSFIMDGQVRCAFCLKADMPMLVRGGENTGVCEPCVAIAHHLWRQAPGEVPPDYPESAKTEVARVYVLIPRLGSTNVEVIDGQEVHTKSNPLLPSSYEFVMRKNEDGLLDLPGVYVQPGEDLKVAAERALGVVKIQTWPHPKFIEPLYTAYTPRGRLAAVMLVTAWRLENVDAVEDGLDWRTWPLSDKPTSMAGFYKALETVWEMRLFKHNRASTHTDAISVRVRGSAATYIQLQQLLRAKTSGLDTSMVEIMKRHMTDDEKKIECLIAEHEVLSQELQAQKKREAEAVGESASMSNEDSDSAFGGSDDESQADKNESGDFGRDGNRDGSEESGFGGVGDDSDGLETVEPSDEVADDDEVASGEEEETIAESPPPEGFARRGRELSMKKEPK